MKSVHILHRQYVNLEDALSDKKIFYSTGDWAHFSNPVTYQEAQHLVNQLNEFYFLSHLEHNACKRELINLHPVILCITKLSNIFSYYTIYDLNMKSVAANLIIYKA